MRYLYNLKQLYLKGLEYLGSMFDVVIFRINNSNNF